MLFLGVDLVRRPCTLPVALAPLTRTCLALRESRGWRLFARSVYELRYFNIADNEGEEED